MTAWIDGILRWLGAQTDDSAVRTIALLLTVGAVATVGAVLLWLYRRGPSNGAPKRLSPDDAVEQILRRWEEHGAGQSQQALEEIRSRAEQLHAELRWLTTRINALESEYRAHQTEARMGFERLAVNETEIAELHKHVDRMTDDLAAIRKATDFLVWRAEQEEKQKDGES